MIWFCRLPHIPLMVKDIFYPSLREACCWYVLDNGTYWSTQFTLIYQHSGMCGECGKVLNSPSLITVHVGCAPAVCYRPGPLLLHRKQDKLAVAQTVLPSNAYIDRSLWISPGVENIQLLPCLLCIAWPFGFENHASI